ncbi:MAG: hypothetical protein ABFE01_11865 [Phycisphaerales bacterium]
MNGIEDENPPSQIITLVIEKTAASKIRKGQDVLADPKSGRVYAGTGSWRDHIGVALHSAEKDEPVKVLVRHATYT